MNLLEPADKLNTASDVPLFDKTEPLVPDPPDHAPARLCFDFFSERLLITEEYQHFRIALDNRFEADLPRIERHVAKDVNASRGGNEPVRKRGPSHRDQRLGPHLQVDSLSTTILGAGLNFEKFSLDLIEYLLGLVLSSEELPEQQEVLPQTGHITRPETQDRVAQILQRHGKSLLARAIRQNQIGLELHDFFKIGVEPAADNVDQLLLNSFFQLLGNFVVAGAAFQFLRSEERRVGKD